MAEHKGKRSFMSTSSGVLDSSGSRTNHRRKRRQVTTSNVGSDANQCPYLGLRMWELPDDLLFHIASYAAAPTHRATVLCHQIATLCQESYHRLLRDEKNAGLWDIVLKEDYGANNNGDEALSGGGRVQRRSCQRLKRNPVHRVRDAHKLIIDNTEIAFFHLSELTSGTSKRKLSKHNLGSLLEEYGPHLRINMIVSSGGLYLVECCRARHVSEPLILNCVRELVEERGALVDLSTNESSQSRQTALCVAAVRGMPSVVKYLIQRGASREVPCSGRFRLYTQPRKTLRCHNATPLEFAEAMRDAEKAAGASDRDLANLNKCIQLLLG